MSSSNTHIYWVVSWVTRVIFALSLFGLVCGLAMSWTLPLSTRNAMADPQTSLNIPPGEYYVWSDLQRAPIRYWDATDSERKVSKDAKPSEFLRVPWNGYRPIEKIVIEKSHRCTVTLKDLNIKDGYIEVMPAADPIGLGLLILAGIIILICAFVDLVNISLFCGLCKEKNGISSFIYEINAYYFLMFGLFVGGATVAMYHRLCVVPWTYQFVPDENGLWVYLVGATVGLCFLLPGGLLLHLARRAKKVLN